MDGLKQWLCHRITVRVCQVAIGVLLAVASLAKLGNLSAFALQIHNFRILPIPTEHLLAVVLPWIELTTALALVLGIRRRAGALVASLLLGVFTLAVASAIARGLDIDCGCFGTADATRIGFGKLAQNLGMLALAAVGSLRPR